VKTKKLWMLGNYKELNVWRKGYDLCLKIYRETKGFPKEEIYGLTSQLRRASISEPFNIAEGYGRQATKDYIQASRNPRPLYCLR